MHCTITWNGDVYEVEGPDPATGAIILEAFLGTHPGIRRSGLALYTVDGMQAVKSHEQVLPGADLILRPGIIR
jgi:hypothetical protein